MEFVEKWLKFISISGVMDSNACQLLFKGSDFCLRSNPDARLCHLASWSLQPLLHEFEIKNISLNPKDAAELLSALKIHFYSIYSKDNRLQSYKRFYEAEKTFNALKIFYKFYMYISKFVYGPQCCGDNFICRSIHCIKSQICIYAKSILQDYIVLTGRNLPNSLQGIKKSIAFNDCCPICTDEDKPDGEFVYLSDCRHIYCKDCFLEWSNECDRKRRNL